MISINEREELIQKFEKYQNLLTQTQRQAFHLHYIEDLSFQEIADLVATTRQAVNDAIRKAIQKINKFDSVIN